MTVDDFLTRHVDGFLLGDLETMANLTGRFEAGDLGRPMVMSVFAGCELLGSLVAPSNPRSAFVTYWVEYLYPGADRVGADALYRLVRQGVGHAFVAKPGIRVTKSHDPRHLTTEGGEYFIDALTLHDDFRASYLRTRESMVERGQPALHELVTWYHNESGELMRSLPSVPAPPRAERADLTLVEAIDGPAA